MAERLKRRWPYQAKVMKTLETVSRRAVRTIEPCFAMGDGCIDALDVSKRRRKPKSADGIRTHNVALLHLRAGTAISNSVLRHVERLLAERNLNLIFGHVDGNGELPQAVRAGNVDGILGYGQFPPEAVTE